MSRAQVGDAGHVFESLLLKTFYSLPWKKIDLAFTTVNEKPGIILTPLASALDCGSEGLKSSAPSSTRFSSSSDEQEKANLAVSHTSTSCILEECYCTILHTYKNGYT